MADGGGGSRTPPPAAGNSCLAPAPTETDPLLGLAAATGGIVGHAHAGPAHVTASAGAEGAAVRASMAAAAAAAPPPAAAARSSYGSAASAVSPAAIAAAAAAANPSDVASVAGSAAGGAGGDDGGVDETEYESLSPLDSAAGYVVRPATAGSARSARSAGSWAGTAPPKLGLDADDDGLGDPLANMTRLGLHAYATCYGLFLTAQLTFCAYAIYLWATHRDAACAHPLATWLLVHGITGIVFLIPVCCLFLVLTNAIGAVLIARRRAEEAHDHPYGRQRRASVDGTSSSGWLDSLANCGLCLVCSLYCVALPLGVFQFVWLIVGTVWTLQLEFADGFSAGSIPTHDVSCNAWLYEFAWYYLGACWLWVVVNCGLTSRVHRSHVRLFFRGGMAVTESDP